MADAGSIYYSALSGLGNNIADAMNQYHKEHQAYDQQMQLADALSRMGVNEQGRPVSLVDQVGKPIKGVTPLIDKNSLESFRTNSHSEQMKSLGALQAINHLGMAYAQQASGPLFQLKRQQLESQIAATNALTQQRLNPTAKTTNPDLNFTHAVNAHNAQVGQIQDYFTNNYGVGPADILNSQAHKGYVFDKDKNEYVDAQKDQTPDAVGVQTGQGFRWLSKDQFNTLKPQAQAWEQLQQNPPKRQDYQTPAPAQQATGGASNAVMQANQIKAAYKAGRITAEQAIQQVRALGVFPSDQ